MTVLAVLAGASTDRLMDFSAALLFLGLLAAVAYVWPVFTATLFLVLGPLGDVFNMTPLASRFQGVSFAAVRPVDAVLTAMLLAVVARVIASVGRREQRFPAVLRWSLSLFALWVLAEIVRNITTYGLSAPGEFRFRYLILSLPVYIGVFFARSRDRRQLLKLTILVATVVSLCFIPLIGMLKGWAVGPDSRFLPAVLSLGLTLGWIALYLSVRYGVLRVSPTVVWSLALPIAGLVLVDSHRSVWLVALVVPIVLLLVGELGSVRIPGWTVPVGAVAGLAAITMLGLGLVSVPNLVTRAEAFTAPRQDATASWRETQWQAQLAVWRHHPLVGQGFGGYWSAGEAYGSSDVSPHSLYVQTLVKLGFAGLALFVAVLTSVAFVLMRALAQSRRAGLRRGLDHMLMVMGVVGLVAMLVFGVAYAFDYYSLLFVGLGMAAAVSKTVRVREVGKELNSSSA